METDGRGGPGPGRRGALQVVRGLGLRGLRTAGWLLAGAWALYLAGAFYVDMRLGLPAGVTTAAFVLAMAAIAAGWRGSRRAFAFVGACVVVTAGWLTIQPTHHRDWEDGMAVLPRAEFRGDEVTIHDVRDARYTDDNHCRPEYLDRRIRLSRVSGLDMYLSDWGSDFIAHPMLSWRFEDGPPITISVEIRGARRETVTPLLGGLYRQYELIYVVSTDRDAVLRRTTLLPVDDRISLYKLTTPPEEARALLISYLETVNSLYESPRFYNTLLNNCVTNVGIHRLASLEGAPWHWDALIPIEIDRHLHRRQGIDSDLPLEEIRARGFRNPAARRIGRADDFWRQIRVGVPGFETLDRRRAAVRPDPPEAGAVDTDRVRPRPAPAGERMGPLRQGRDRLVQNAAAR